EDIAMTPSTLLLWGLLQSVGVTSQCRQGATFSEAVLSPALSSSSIQWVPGVSSLARCLVSCCDHLHCDLAWLFQRRCYILICHQGETCRPQDRPGADSYLAFVRRGPPQTLVLGSLVRGEPYGGRWRPSGEVSEAPGDLEALRDLAVLEGEEGPQDRGGGGGDLQAGLLSHWPEEESEDREEWSVTESSLADNGSSSPGALREQSPNFPPAENTPLPYTGQIITGETELHPTEPYKYIPSHPGHAPAVCHYGYSDINSQVLFSPVRDVVLNASQSEGVGLLGCEWEQIGGPPVHLGRSADPWSLYLTHLDTPGNYTFRVTVTDSAGSSDHTTATVLVVPANTSRPPAGIPSSARPSTSDPTNAPPPRRKEDPTVASPTPIAPSKMTDVTAVTVQVPGSQAEEAGLNRSPVAVVGPDRKLVLPVGSVILDGSESRDDQAVVRYLWEATSAPPGLMMEGADRAVATATGLRLGRYTFKLTVSDQQGATDSAVLTVRVEEASVVPPVAHASGSHTLTLPNNSLVLRGSVTGGDQTQVHFLWVRDSQSPAAGDVLYSSETQASLHLCNLVEGTYLFQLRVTDAQGRGSVATATVEVRPEGPLPGSKLVQVLRNQLLREKTDYLLFRVLRVDTVFCLLRCSGRGQCDPITKECVCDPFWTENLIRRFFGDRERNCEWRVLYVVMSSFLALVLVLIISWSLVCCCRRKRSKVRKKTKYTILDDMDDQERAELRPKHGIKHRSTEHASSLMMSESELDSEQDTLFSRDRPVRSRGRGLAQAASNGNAFG
ncbi:hypothetical protein CRUP_028514, partial [Coryphaenoides rupestris]